MTIIDLEDTALTARISTRGGAVLGLWWENDGERVPLLRSARSDDADALSSGCYPLVPFGNRVRNNRFTFDGRTYAFEPNTISDPHYLHGDGWLGEWSVVGQSDRHVELSFSHEGKGTPYRYEARQSFTIDDGVFEMRMAVTNLGEALPFGLGWHPYFPMTDQTTLRAPAVRMWTEAAGWLPGEATDILVDLDFSVARPLPHRWVNNGFEGWTGEAQISWPDRRTRLHLTADSLFKHAFVFVSDVAFDPSFQRDYFCFEPMSHLANGHNLPGLGDLIPLATGEVLAGGMRLQPQAIVDPVFVSRRESQP
jgi:aldose 1-epimerase